MHSFTRNRRTYRNISGNLMTNHRLINYGFNEANLKKKLVRLCVNHRLVASSIISFQVSSVLSVSK